MTTVPKIAVGYPYTLRVTMPDDGSDYFPSGGAWRSEVREFQGARRKLAELTTANGGIVRVSSRIIDLVMTGDQTATFRPDSIVLDWARTDGAAPSYFGYILQLPVVAPVTVADPDLEGIGAGSGSNGAIVLAALGVAANINLSPPPLPGVPGAPGDDGREVEFQKSATHIQWRYVGAVSWTNLVALTDIEGDQGNPGTPGTPGVDGDDGREVEFQKSATHIQWRYVGDVSWTNLVALTDIKGDQGNPGTPGAPGVDGDDGREVELQKTATHVQWRYVGDVSWTNIVALTDIKGDQGVQGPPPPVVEFNTIADYNAITPVAGTLYVIRA